MATDRHGHGHHGYGAPSRASTATGASAAAPGHALHKASSSAAYRTGAGTNNPNPSNTMSTTTTSSSTVRRNLFQNPMTRRAPASSSNNSAESLRLEADAAQQPESNEIVVRNKNGEIELGDPPTPLLDDDDQDDLAALEERQHNERERQRLAEAVRQHQMDQNGIGSHPEELLEAVRASLRAKVAALAEDNWMFEREELQRHQ